MQEETSPTRDDQLLRRVYRILRSAEAILVVANFDAEPRGLVVDELVGQSSFSSGALEDLITEERFSAGHGDITIPGYGFRWLRER